MTIAENGNSIPQIRIDARLPQQMAEKAESIGVAKIKAPRSRQFFLAVLAGAFIALGAIFATTVATGSEGMPYGVSKLLVGLVFSLGLILVIVGGAELFTGNNLIIMAWASGKIKIWDVIRNWIVVYIGNFVGAFGTAVLMFFSKQYEFSGGAVGVTMLKIAMGKCELEFLQALVLGVMCNVLVCLAVWLTFSARSTIDRIMAIIFPITAFVAAGFEHSIANMYFIPIGLLIKDYVPGFAAASGLDLSMLTWQNFIINNLIPVTLGNLFGGAVLVGAMYWMIYLKDRNK
jgi:formate transporter